MSDESQDQTFSANAPLVSNPVFPRIVLLFEIDIAYTLVQNLVNRWRKFEPLRRVVIAVDSTGPKKLALAFIIQYFYVLLLRVSFKVGQAADLRSARSLAQRGDAQPEWTDWQLR